jgi:hypothetical protein
MNKVMSMGKQPAEKDKPKKPAPSGDAHSKPKQPKDKEKTKAKVEPAADKEKEAAKEKEQPKAPPRPPADPRLKVLKKFHGKFLPRGPLRDRHKALMARWNSGEDHGGVSVEELKSLHSDWKAARAKPVRVSS